MKNLLTCLVAFVFVMNSHRGAAATRLPNVILILADDLGYSDVGVYGAKGFNTPNLDRLANEGIRFTDFHVAQAVCSASRAALMTDSSRLAEAFSLDAQPENGGQKCPE